MGLALMVGVWKSQPQGYEHEGTEPSLSLVCHEVIWHGRDAIPATLPINTWQAEELTPGESQPHPAHAAALLQVGPSLHPHPYPRQHSRAGSDGMGVSDLAPRT